MRLDLAQKLEARVTLVTVLEPLPGYVQMAAVVDPAMPETLRKAKHAQLVDLQTRACEKAKAHGLNMATILVESSEVSGLLNAIRMASPDLLVIGRQAHASSIEYRVRGNGAGRRQRDDLSGTCGCIKTEEEKKPEEKFLPFGL